MKILTTNGQVEELNTEKLASTSSEESTEYKNTISEILIFLKVT